MYLTLRQHDQFRTLLMGFEIPYRTYIARTIIREFPTENDFKVAVNNRKNLLSSSDSLFLRQTLPQICKGNKLHDLYNKLMMSKESALNGIIVDEQEVPVVGALNIITFTFLKSFEHLYSLFGDYVKFCSLAEEYRYSRNKLERPGCKTLEENNMVPVLAFIKDICIFLDEEFFWQKPKAEIISEIISLQSKKVKIPIDITNFVDMPFSESKIVCRANEIKSLKEFIYGNPGDLRKKHSCCVFGYGGVGKTALVLETIKEIVQDILDDCTINGYEPKYILFFSAKTQKLDISSSSGKVIEKELSKNFSTAEELISLIYNALNVFSFSNFHKEGVVVIDNLESLDQQERLKTKRFIEAQTPSEMQFLITSRGSEDYEQNLKLGGFERENGAIFINKYIEENNLEIDISSSEVEELLSLSKGNTLVLVLCLRRLSHRLASLPGLITEFSSSNAWKAIRNGLKNIPGNAYEVVSEFMFKDTFEELENVFASDFTLFYEILKIFAVYQKSGVDLNTICILSKKPYPKVEAVADVLCNYLILEKSGEIFSLNNFAEKYIVNRFLPDSITYEELSIKIQQRERQVQSDLAQLEIERNSRKELRIIMQDWRILADCDKIAAANLYRLYGDISRKCQNDSRLRAEQALSDAIQGINEAEAITIHPFIKFQKARILNIIDRSKILEEVHTEEIISAYRDAIFIIKTVDQYSQIQQTKSYASLLWLYGQYLSDNNYIEESIRYLEESCVAFRNLNIIDKEYYKCLSKLGYSYLNFYTLDKDNRIKYLLFARNINQILLDNYKKIGEVKFFANQLKQELQKYKNIKG